MISWRIDAAVPAALLLLLLPACGFHEDRSRQIGDGSVHLRVAVQAMPGFLPPDGSIIREENGVGFLYVDGTCRYWVQLIPTQGVRTGVLDAAQEDGLTADLLYRG